MCVFIMCCFVEDFNSNFIQLIFLCFCLFTDKYEDGPSCSQEYQDFTRYDDFDFKANYYEYELGQAEPIVKGRLKASLSFWKDIGANSFIIDIIAHGYKIPFFSTPPSVCLPNNQSALHNSVFVSEAIDELLSKGLITQCSNIPFVVNPLTVSIQRSGKARLILDLRHVNIHVWKEKVKFDDWQVAMSYFSSECFMFAFDLKSGYHHIEMFEDHCEYLGFAWSFNGETRYYKFLVLPFGLSSAPFVFTKCLRPLVRRWREQGMFIVMFLDDGWCVAKNADTLRSQSTAVKNDLIAAGFVPNVDKSHWEPSQSIVWLGMNWDGLNGRISISDKRITDIHDSIELFIQRLPMTSARVLASLVGKLMSLKPVVGGIAQLKTRFLHFAILARRHWDDLFSMNRFQLAIEEVLFWKGNLDSLNSRNVHNSFLPQVVLFSDASGTGFGATTKDCKMQCCHTWDEGEKLESSTWRELKAVQFALFSFASQLEGKTVKVFTDNKGVVAICKKGSMKLELHSMAIAIFDICKRHSVNLEIEWIPRSQNEEADLLSREIDYDDWGVSQEFFSFMDNLWGPHSVDRFADHLNFKISNFNSKFWCPGTSQVDAFAMDWSSENNWLVPPVRLIPAVLRHVKVCKAVGSLVIPVWSSAPFWPLLFSPYSEFKQLVRFSIKFSDPSNIFVQGRNKNSIFGSKSFTSHVMCLKLVG